MESPQKKNDLGLGSDDVVSPSSAPGAPTVPLGCPPLSSSNSSAHHSSNLSPERQPSLGGDTVASLCPSDATNHDDPESNKDTQPSTPRSQTGADGKPKSSGSSRESREERSRGEKRWISHEGKRKGSATYTRTDRIPSGSSANPPKASSSWPRFLYIKSAEDKRLPLSHAAVATAIMGAATSAKNL